MSREPWDFGWMLAAVQTLETYEAAVETAEFPSLILAALDELLEAPEANATQLQELADVLVQMIAFPLDTEIPHETLTLLHSTRDWAIQTLLDVQTAQSELTLTLSKPLQLMQSKLFVSAPCRQTDVEVGLSHSLLAALQTDEQDSDTVSDVLELCATSLQNGEQFLEFTEAALSGKTETLIMGSSFLQRLFDRRGRRLFDSLALESRVRVWANHLPSWRTQLQSWMLEAQQVPFKPISDVLPEGWLLDDGTAPVATACRRYSHLYVTLIEWCRCHVDLLSSCRSMELVSALSRGTRPENAARLFSRELLSQVPTMNRSRGQLEGAFISFGRNLERLEASRSASDIVWQYEWIGVLERPHLLYEALEAAFNRELDSDEQYAAQFFGWFYSFTSSESTDEIVSVLTTVSKDLRGLDVRSGAQWLRRSRAEFGTLPIFRLRLVWIWLLKRIETEQQAATLAATTDVLESVEYIFRRFTPPRAKRLFQVELVTQLIVELEWRVMDLKTRSSDGFAPLRAWLEKIVRLMQLEGQKDNRRSHRSQVNDVQHLTERLQHLSG